jgi:hypothetical protein
MAVFRMDQEAILAELENLVGSIGMEIRYEKGDFKGETVYCTIVKSL